MEITRNGSRPSSKGPEQYFSGSVRVDPVFQVGDPARLNAGSVTFEPGARTAWHTHPLGQTLVITAGLGWVQSEGGPIQEVRPGDVVWFPPGERHWHGATPTTGMTHIAVQEIAQRQERGLDGESQRRAVSALIELPVIVPRGRASLRGVSKDGSRAGWFETHADSAMALPAPFRPDGLRQIGPTGKISLFPKGKSPL